MTDGGDALGSNHLIGNPPQKRVSKNLCVKCSVSTRDLQFCLVICLSASTLKVGADWRVGYGAATSHDAAFQGAQCA